MDEKTKRKIIESFDITPDDVEFLQWAANLDTETDEPESDSETPDTEEILKLLATIIIDENPTFFCEFVAAHREIINEAASIDDDIVRMLILGYKFGIAEKNGASANDLSALYYMGNLVEQDYVKAAVLYELAIQWGCDQSIINMGYIYEYGRIGEPDYAKAYEYYSLAAALTQMSEALYKLGDMYSRGHNVAKSMATAVQLWRRSYEKAETPIEIAQPAIRLAPLYLDGSEELEIEADPMYALRLFQQAEIGLRIDINEGQTYYEKRLRQAIEGQEKARLRLDNITIA